MAVAVDGAANVYVADTERSEVVAFDPTGRPTHRFKPPETFRNLAAWADKVKVKFSISKGPRTLAKELVALPDEEFHVGDMVEIGRMKVVIHKIKCRDGMVREGGAEASTIVRVYAKGIKETWA